MLQAVFLETDRRSTAEENILISVFTATHYCTYTTLRTIKTLEQNDWCVCKTTRLMQEILLESGEF
jgi:hypothetical protein